MPLDPRKYPASGSLVGIEASRANTMVVGPSRSIARVVSDAAPALRAPVRTWAPHQPCDLPEIDCGTLIVSDLPALTIDDQQKLRLWLDAHPQVRVISTAERSLLPLVRSGSFSASLYYRLNLLYVALGSPS